MRVQLFVLCLLCTTLVSAAQPSGWFTSKAEATEYAAKLHIPVLYVFAGSDWCKPCIQLKQTILLSDTFQAYYPEKLAILYLDFPQQKKNQLSPELKKQNEELASRYNKNGYFPNMILLDSQEKPIGNLYFKHQTAIEFIQQVETLIQK